MRTGDGDTGLRVVRSADASCASPNVSSRGGAWAIRVRAHCPRCGGPSGPGTSLGGDARALAGAPRTPMPQMCHQRLADTGRGLAMTNSAGHGARQRRVRVACAWPILGRWLTYGPYRRDDSLMGAPSVARAHPVCGWKALDLLLGDAGALDGSPGLADVECAVLDDGEEHIDQTGKADTLTSCILCIQEAAVSEWSGVVSRVCEHWTAAAARGQLRPSSAARYGQVFAAFCRFAEAAGVSQPNL